MNQDETLALWKQGKEVWNDWAQKMLAERKALEDKGEWDVNVAPWGEHPQNEITQKWFEDARAVFSSKETPHLFPDATSFQGWLFPSVSEWNAATFMGKARFDSATFEGNADFDSATFKGEGRFDSATFEGNADFNSAEFKGVAGFNSATFEGVAKFDSATFEHDADFDSATFNGHAWFISATFKDVAWFNSATFEHDADFDSTTFNGHAWFVSATFKDVAWFNGATFERDAEFNSVCFEKPTRFSDARFNTNASFNSAQIKQAFDLSGARFKEVPDFRQTHCEEAPLLDDVHIDSTVIKQRKSSHYPDFTVIANYRALKRLAIQGHDHKHEVEFFAEELRSKRLLVDKRWHWDWILSGIFQITSDYGRSILRPLLFWLLIVGLSATSYLLTAKQSMDKVALQCVKGEGWQWVSAIQLAIGKGLLFPGIADRTLIMQAYDCLYGDTIPTLTSAALGLQTLLSSALLFLILLGIRNRFKLK
ncbi:pentapeptide repeat-containing protein [Thalassospira lucentensis]|uniref:pentapeptide repeat-containing protein n=1 Tax=Thalassospira lucentensis TaxID=168935 RepID=UPI00142D68C1|nr:pentapeptide repeat-containing protein [Thalassospira lucentensis]NIZ02477.1 hypothetical protein [Thalassospira lucentensis]